MSWHTRNIRMQRKAGKPRGISARAFMDTFSSSSGSRGDVPAVPTAALEQIMLDAQRAHFHALITDPATGPKLDVMLADNAATDAAIEAERLEQDDRDEQCGSQCGAGCGYCGRCS